MTVTITCPTCKAQVTLVTNGVVRAHGDPRCSFTKTPGNKASGGVKKVLTGAELELSQQQKAESRARRTAAAAANPKLAKKPKAQKNGPAKVICTHCGGRTALVSMKRDLGLKAHLRPSGRWCSAGVPPTDGQRAKARRKRSVWTTSGGLPTLGGR